MLSAEAMKKTGSELISEMVGPAGSMSDGAFSRCMPGADADEDELCELEDDCPWERTGAAESNRSAVEKESVRNDMI